MGENLKNRLANIMKLRSRGGGNGQDAMASPDHMRPLDDPMPDWLPYQRPMMDHGRLLEEKPPIPNQLYNNPYPSEFDRLEQSNNLPLIRPSPPNPARLETMRNIHRSSSNSRSQVVTTTRHPTTAYYGGFATEQMCESPAYHLRTLDVSDDTQLLPSTLRPMGLDGSASCEYANPTPLKQPRVQYTRSRPVDQMRTVVIPSENEDIIVSSLAVANVPKEEPTLLSLSEVQPEHIMGQDPLVLLEQEYEPANDMGHDEVEGAAIKPTDAESDLKASEDDQRYDSVRFFQGETSACVALDPGVLLPVFAQELGVDEIDDAKPGQNGGRSDLVYNSDLIYQVRKEDEYQGIIPDTKTIMADPGCILDAGDIYGGHDGNSNGVGTSNKYEVRPSAGSVSTSGLIENPEVNVFRGDGTILTGTSNAMNIIFAPRDSEIAGSVHNRFYFNKTTGGRVVTVGREPQPAATIPAGQDWKCTVDSRHLEKGWHSIILCITLGATSTTSLNSFTIDAKQLDVNGRPVYMRESCKTALDYDELREIPMGIPTRLRLHRQIELTPGASIELRVNLSTVEFSDAMLHYVELMGGQTEIEDLVLYGAGRPQHVVDVGRGRERSSERTIAIHSFEISSSGTHAATLCFENGHGIIETWSLFESESSKQSASAGLRLHSTSLARGVVRGSSTTHPDFIDICLSISRTGSVVAVHSTEALEDAVTCHILKSTPSEPKDKHVFSPCKLSTLNLPKSLNNFVGESTFHIYESGKFYQDQKERFITCDGLSVNIYATDGEWFLIGTIILGVEPNQDAAIGILSSLRGRYFAWTGQRGVVSIWDLNTLSQVSYVQVEGAGMGVSANISSDGSTMAISVKGRISIYETISGIKLGDYLDGLGEDKQFEVVLEKEHFMFREQTPLKDMGPKEIIRRRVVRIRDMSLVRTYPIHRDYLLRFPNPPGDQLLLYSQGSVLNIIQMSGEIVTAPSSWSYEQIPMDRVRVDHFAHSVSQEFTSRAGATFTLTTAATVVNGNWMTMGTIVCTRTAVESSGRTLKSVTVPLGSSHMLYSSVFLPASSRLALVAGRYLQIWRLSDTASAVAELELIWILQADNARQEAKDLCLRKVSAAIADSEGRQFVLELQPETWFRRLKKLPTNPLRQHLENVTFPFSSMDSLSITEEYRGECGIRGAIDLYIGGDAECQKTVIRYLKTLVRPSSKNRLSCIVKLCRLWKLDEKIYFEEILAALLPADEITWIPDVNQGVIRDPANPLSILLSTAETQPGAIGAAKVIMDYCTNHANSSKNLAFLAPIFGSMNEVMTLFQEEALDCLSRMAFIPAKQRSYIIDNHLIAHPPHFRLRFWKPVSKPLCKTVDPIMQLQPSPFQPDQSNSKFTHPVFMASFDALWFYHDVKKKSVDTNKATKPYRGILAPSLPVTKSLASAPETTTTTTWWKTLFYMILLKLHLRSQMYVECYDFNLEFFDNPAIAALVAYKWNTIGFKYWLVRFVFQCIYYLLVVIAALLQVYLADPTVLPGLFIAIIVMAAVFLWLEILQAIQGWAKYKGSSYNILDVIAFLVPMAASIDQLVVIYLDHPNGNARLLSFSVLIVFLHTLFELRINKSVCKYVTIIQQVVIEIQVFFIILAAGILAFTIGMLHLLHACPVGGCAEGDSGSDFPMHFFGALSTTYFFMGGLYDPILEKINSQDWGFHIMMMIFFFFTVILMLNVLIALINVAFIKGDDGWRLVWVESRLRYIESAENMSYHIPGYRQARDCFPKEIYFTATMQQVKKFKKKQGLISAAASETTASTKDATESNEPSATDARVEELQRQMASQQERTEMQLQELKDLLLQSRSA